MDPSLPPLPRHPIGIVGHEAAKFSPATEQEARRLIRDILREPPMPILAVSGHCHLGGVDIWVEEEAAALHIPVQVFPPKTRAWPDYKARNIQIAEASDVVHVVVVDRLPATYTGMRFPLCYHDGRTDHQKSGACWTAKYAMKLGKEAVWHIVKQVPDGV